MKNTKKNSNETFLYVGLFDSSVGYAWNLVEDFWCKIASKNTEGRNLAVFPSVSLISDKLGSSNIEIKERAFHSDSFFDVLSNMRFIRSENIKLIYLTDLRTSSYKYLLYKLAGVKKIIVHDHTPGIRTKPRWLVRLLRRLIHLLPSYQADACIGVSPYISKRLIEVNLIDSTKVFTVTNGIKQDAPFISSQPIKNKRDIVTVSRANMYKGIDFALQVVAYLVQTGFKNIHYHFYGDGPDLDYFKQLANSLGIKNFVTFHGKVNSVGQELVHADLALHPSKGEAMSLAILEYMRAGLPIVVSDNASVNSALTDGEDARFYPEGNVEAAGELLRETLSNAEAMSKYGANARKNFLTKYTEERMFESFDKVIEQILTS